MNRIEEKLAQLKEQNKKAFITYMTAGMPDFDKMQEIYPHTGAGGNRHHRAWNSIFRPGSRRPGYPGCFLSCHLKRCEFKESIRSHEKASPVQKLRFQS